MVGFGYDGRTSVDVEVQPGPAEVGTAETDPEATDDIATGRGHADDFVYVLPVVASFPVVIDFFVDSGFVEGGVEAGSGVGFDGGVVDVDLIACGVAFVLGVVCYGVEVVGAFFGGVGVVVVFVFVGGDCVSGGYPCVAGGV